MLETAQSYLSLSGQNIGMWQRDGRTEMVWLLQQSALRCKTCWSCAFV